MAVSQSYLPGKSTERYAILGDIHSNLEALTAVLKDAREQSCTQYACLGDIVGYNANPRECLEIIRDLGMSCVKGNHDEYASTNKPLDGFNPRAAAVISWTRQQLGEAHKEWLRNLKLTHLVSSFLIVHATLDAPHAWGYIFDKWAAAASFTYQSTALCFFGHTHVPVTFVRGSDVQMGTYFNLQLQPGLKYLVNVGSVGEPRDGNPAAAYVIYDNSTRTIELRRLPYDRELTEAKLCAAGLPDRRPG